jgi:peptidoglycan L-alanyl-D-glutamate endopeptidase CwlK
MEPVSEERLKLVYPGLAEKVRQMADILLKEGILIRVTQGLRTVAEQCALYAQGRSKPGKVVTNCQGGHSYHNFGLAVDCCPSTDAVDKPFKPEWDETRPAWKRMVQVGESVGLNSGSAWIHFKDVPHFQLTGKWPVGAPPSEARVLITEGLPAVWKVAFPETVA